MIAGISRGLSRHLAPSDAAALPFLYCTRTILRGYASSATHPDEGHVPFEGLPSHVDSDGRLSTVSKFEHKAYQRLLKLQPPNPASKPTTPARASAAAGEEPDPDDLMEQILADLVPRNEPQLSDLPSDSLTSQPFDLAAKEREARLQHSKELRLMQVRARRARSEKVNAAVIAEHKSMQERVRAAQTDVEVWDIYLAMLDRVRALRLDFDPSPELVEGGAEEQAQAPSAPDAASRAEWRRRRPLELRILSEVLPIHMTTIQRSLTDGFPSSPLGLSVLPALRELGPAAFALGVSSDLYAYYLKRLRHAHPLALGSFTDVVVEMDSEIVNFNRKIYNWLLEAVVRTSQARHGYIGDARRILCSTNNYRSAFKTLNKWQMEVKKRLHEAAIAETAKAEEKRASSVVGTMKAREKSRQKREQALAAVQQSGEGFEEDATMPSPQEQLEEADDLGDGEGAGDADLLEEYAALPSAQEESEQANDWDDRHRAGDADVVDQHQATNRVYN